MGRLGKDSRQVLGTQTGELSDDDDVSGLQGGVHLPTTIIKMNKSQIKDQELEMIYSQGLVSSAPTGGHRVKVPEAAEKCSQPQGFPPRMINLIGVDQYNLIGFPPRMINTT